ncbi:hypothetical protein BDM02DRAFT_3124262 [Thelephora ganbajun]|uniref:Uncharacterized protein n=1 Tax=Thelephora ganbajun TaxID=370292 RepID=A0ACB6YZ82_THEGA|nr:hypothetical protein BDM02DRAFT_3124262 [Thelephora ganbajun]
MSPSSSTLSRARKTIFWLFLDPVNTNAESRAIDLSGYDWVNMRVDEFMEMKLSPAMQKWFDFHPRLSTLRLWIVSLPALLSVLCLNSHSASRSHPTTRHHH